ncbi:MAG: 4Fe-4S dicluster domain-containing protein [Bacteroidota bacterium]
MNKIDPGFAERLKKYGAVDINACYNCGNCTAICPLSDENNSFPRKMLRASVLGADEKIEISLDPWLCYYCGECTDTCPREANPGELMMSLRRYLISVYDWTGLSKLFYTKKIWELIFILIMAAVVVGLFIVFFPMEKIAGFSSYIGNEEFVHWVEIGDWAMAATIGGLLITNILRMWYKTIIKSKVKVPVVAYITEFFNLILHFVTQIRFKKCDASGRRYWVFHLLIMTGYTIMFIMIVGLLPWFQTAEVNAWHHPQRLLGYYATFGLLTGLTIVIVQRIKKYNARTEYSHYSDWMFLILLYLTTVTGILVHIFRLVELDQATFYIYVVHLAVLVPMLVIEVPFSKWSHLAYRPFAVYFDKLKAKAKAKS